MTLGSTVGFVLGLTSAGSGTLIAIGLILGFRLAPRRVVGTDVFHAALLLWVAAIAHLFSGNVDLLLTATILIGSLPGVWVGTQLATRLPERGLRPGARRRPALRRPRAADQGRRRHPRRRHRLRAALARRPRLLRAPIDPRKNSPYRKDRPVTAITTPALSHLRALEAEAIHVMREVAAEREKPALLFSGGKDSIVLVRLAQKAFAPGKVPFPLLHIDTGPQLPRGHRLPRPARGRARPGAARRVRAGVDRHRPRARGDRPARLAQPPADRDAAGRDRRATSSTPASAAPAATRSAPAPRSAC